MGDWDRYQELVLKELQDLKECQCKAQEELGVIKVEIATLKVRAGLWGSLAAMITTAVVYFASIKGLFK